MKLLNHSLAYLSASILAIVSIWSVIFYINMLDEIDDSIDDGLENYKMLIIQKADLDSTILHKAAFDESNYAIQKITQDQAINTKETYKDTLMYMLSEEDLEPVRVLTTAFSHQNDYYRLSVISSTVEEDDLIEDLFWAIFWLYILLLVAIILINNIVLRKLWKPFYDMLHHLKAFRLDKNENLQDIPTRTHEFIELKSAINILTAHTLEAYNNQKQFTENAAHELQTPLATAIGKLELLLEKNSLSTDNAQDIAQVLQIIERLIRLNKSLLLLSKIDNKQFYANQDVSMNQVVRQCVDDLEDIAAFRSVILSVSEKNTLMVNIDPALATTLVFNLIKNAITYNIPDGNVLVEIKKQSISVTNTGRNSAVDKDKIFNRFQKDTSEQSGTGLGLAIVKSICKLYGFEVSYQFTGLHRFEISFQSQDTARTSQ